MIDKSGVPRLAIASPRCSKSLHFMHSFFYAAKESAHSLKHVWSIQRSPFVTAISAKKGKNWADIWQSGDQGHCSPLLWVVVTYTALVSSFKALLYHSQKRRAKALLTALRIISALFTLLATSPFNFFTLLATSPSNLFKTPFKVFHPSCNVTVQSKRASLHQWPLPVVMHYCIELKPGTHYQSCVALWLNTHSSNSKLRVMRIIYSPDVLDSN